MKPDSIITFGIADDDLRFRKTVISTLCISSDVKAVFCCDNGLDLIKKTILAKPKLILVDLYMPVISGLEAIKAIRNHSSELKILAISSLFQLDVLHELKKHGVNGYCSRTAGDIKIAFSEIVKNESYFNVQYFDFWVKRAERITNPKPVCNYTFTGTEIDILKLASEGSTNKEIGDKLNLSNRTVDHYVSRLVHRLNLRSKNELVRFAFENGYCTVHCENSKAGNCSISGIFSHSYGG